LRAFDPSELYSPRRYEPLVIGHYRRSFYLIGRLAFMRLLFWLLPSLVAAQSYDIVLQSGRVMDPESGLDAVRSVGITGNKIALVSQSPLRGKIEVDATNLVIAPGFIDLHQHSQTSKDYGFKAMDGVTTALELEVGVSPVSPWYAERRGESIINFGASSGHIPARMAIMHDTGGLLPRDAAMNRPASIEEQKTIAAAVQKGLDAGGLGLGMGIVYTPTATPEEILNLFYTAAKFKRPVFVHMRATGNVISAMQEVITDAAASGAPLHIVHINSSATQKTPEALRLIEGVRARGLDVTTEAYPYTAGMTEIASARYSGLENQPPEYFATMLWPPTGERLTRESFERYRRQGGFVAQFTNTEDMVRVAISNPIVMIASDGISEHPRSAGTYARVLGKYVRDEKALTLMDAIRKSSLLPAQRLEAMSPQMRHKGRVKPGADADLSVFDADSVIDKATFEKPALYSDGFRYVLVNGTFVVRDGKLQAGVHPGQGIQAR
jgi:N-acyl-D-aspartate/D-glutamate deacylase